MTTWNSVTIKNPGAITVEMLEGINAFNGEGQMWESHEIDTFDGGTIYAQGHSKWQAADLIEAIEALSLEHPDATFTHYEEWDDDGVGARETVYRGGSSIVTESRMSGMVPANLAELVATLRAALDAKVLAKHETHKETRYPIQEAARALVDALDPRGAASADS